MLTVDPESLKYATPKELADIERALIREKALLLPLDYALHVSEGRVKAYPHTELLSRHAKALVDHAIYDSGIGVPAEWVPNKFDPDDGKWVDESSERQLIGLRIKEVLGVCAE